MDPAIVELLKARAGKNRLKLDQTNQALTLVNEDNTDGKSRPIRPLVELYGQGTGLDDVEFDDQRFLSLLLAIEEPIYDADRAINRLTDSAVLAALDRLCMNPDAAITNDPVAEVIQFNLRVTLSLNDFSRQDVRMCLRKVKQSTARHTKTGGVRGYLNFLRQQFTRQRGHST